MKKKAFTLIELLAVIIILAVIALIATPIVLNVVSDAREKAKVESANGIIDATNLYINEAMLDSSKSTSGNIYDSIKANIKGEKPDTAEVYINENNQVAVALQFGDSCYKKDYTETTPKKVEDANCSLFTPTDESCFEYTTNKVVSYDVDYDACKIVFAQISQAMGADFGDDQIASVCTGGILNGVTLYDVISNPNYLEYFTTSGAVSNVITEDIEGVRITGYTCSDTDIVIPKMIDGKNIIEIGSMSLMYKGLTSVIIPNTVKTIGANAFYVNQLTNIIIGNNVKTIETWAFSENQLESVVIPNSVESIGHGAFSWNQIESVSIGNSVKTIGEYAFSENQLESVVIPNSVKTIGAYAFSSSSDTRKENGITYVNNPNLSSITIDKEKDSIEGSPWGASKATITYLR